MNALKGMLYFACLALATAFANGQEPAVDSDQFRASLVPQGYVSDWAGIFSTAQKMELESKIAAFKQTNGSELAVVALKTLHGGEIEDFAGKLFEQWGIGEKGKDNGVLLIAAIEDRRMRIEVGYGCEGVLTDSGTGRIQDEKIVPRFKEGNYAQGMYDGAMAILAVLEKGEPPEDPRGAEGNPIVGLVFFVFIVCAFIWIVRLAARGGKGGGGSSSTGSLGGGFKSSGGGGGFGGFGGGSSGGGGSSRGW